MKRSLILALVATIATPGVHASTIRYRDNRSGFLAATGAGSIGALPASGGDGTVVGGVEFTGVFGSVSFGEFSNEIEGNDIGFDAAENFDMAITEGAYAIGFDLHEPAYTSVDGCNSLCADSNFTIELFFDSTSVGIFNYNAPNDADSGLNGLVGFFGVHSSEIFNRVEVRELFSVVDNEYFGNFLIGKTALEAPEPGSLALLGLGLLGLGLTRRRAN